MNINTNNQTLKYFYLVGLIGLASYLVVHFIFISNKKEIIELRRVIIEQKLELENKLERDKNMLQLNENIKKIEPQINKLDTIYADNERKLEFITMLEDIAKKNQIEQQLDLQLVKTVKEKNYSQIPLSISARGDLNRILNYLSNLEDLSIYININVLSLRISPQKTGAGNEANLSISAQTFWK